MSSATPGRQEVPDSPSMWRSIVTVAGGTGIAQLVPLIVFPLVARHYGPEALYDYLLFLAITAPLTILLGFRVDMAVLSAHDERSMRAILAFGLVGVAGLGLVVSGVSLLVHATSIESWPVARLFPASPVCAAFIALNLVLIAAGTFRRRYRAIAVAQVLPATLAAMGQVACVALRLSAEWLIYTYIVSQLLTFLGLFCWLVVVGDVPLRALVTREAYPTDRDDWRAITRFGVFSTPADLINSLASLAPLALLGGLRGGREDAAAFGVVQRYAGAPLAFVTRSMSLVFRGEAAAELRHSGHCMTSFMRILRGLGLIALGATVIGEVALHLIVPAVLGPAWDATIPVFALVLPLMMLRGVGATLSLVMLLRQQQLTDLVLQFIFLVISVGPFLVFDTARAALVGFVLGGAIFQVVAIVLYARVAGLRADYSRVTGLGG